MLQRQGYRNIKRLFLFAILLLVVLGANDSGYANEKWILWHGVENLGGVTVLNEDGHNLVPIDHVATMLKLEVDSDAKHFLVKKGNNSLEFVPNAAVAKKNGQDIVPLPFIPIYRDGHWWMEANTTLKILKPIVNDGKTLKWAGKADAAEDRPSISVNGMTVQGNAGAIADKGSAKNVASKIVGIRWGKWDDRIRLVIDLLYNITPSVDKKPSELVLKFDGVVVEDQVKSMKQNASFPTVSVSQKDGAAIINIKHQAQKIAYFSLSSPPRYVVDFFGNDNVVNNDVIAKKDNNNGVPVPSNSQGGSNVAAPRGTKPHLVVIDPGHGGKDPGARANGVVEKDINLKMGQILANILESRGIKTRMTRSQDIYLRLDERTKLANDWDGDLFVSLHCNALPAGRSAKGVEIYIMALPSDEDAMRLALIENRELGEGTENVDSIADKRTKLLLKILGDMEQNVKIEQSMSFAEVLYKAGSNKGLNMRRVAQAPFFVLRGAAMPAVLVEMGFLTDKAEASLLANPTYQKKLAESLADGIESYLRNM
ncbi:MAG TPA: N-acetylmuramoyl-L-alanine amidase [Acetomicrobium flavidum]|uniref:N-acetylmuramoyl-L-alanine amidase family protein n=1 Tax=Acetomicrobium flavidum TaxID=49896 RepID=UPI002CB18CCB|nr:N-acetylmuramoyl-L-alanine amidase [Acetomicrobium flavidum]